MMPSKYAIIGVVIWTLLAFGVGYRVAEGTAKPLETSKTDAKTDTRQAENKDVQTVTKVIYIQKPDGTKETDTTTTQDTVLHFTIDKDTNQVSAVAESPTKVGTTNVSLLAGTNITSAPTLSYGLSVTKQFIGPVTLGIFGLTNGTVGASIGINF